MEEIWKDISGYEGFYQASNLGRIRGCDRVIRGRKIKSKLLQPNKVRGEYLGVVLSKKNKSKTLRLNRIIALLFVPNPLSLPEVNHIDEIKANNEAENLEWCTKLYNIQYGSGISRRSKLNKEQIFSILKDKRTCRKIGDDYNVHGTTISQIKRGLIHKQLLITN